MPGDDWVQVQNCNWLHEAQFLQLGGVRLLVRPEDVERASEVLASAAIDDDRDPGA